MVSAWQGLTPERAFYFGPFSTLIGCQAVPHLAAVHVEPLANGAAVVTANDTDLVSVGAITQTGSLPSG